MKNRKRKSGRTVPLCKKKSGNLCETLELLSTPGLLKSVRKAKEEIRKGETYSLKKVFG